MWNWFPPVPKSFYVSNYKIDKCCKKNTDLTYITLNIKLNIELNILNTLDIELNRKFDEI